MNRRSCLKCTWKDKNLKGLHPGLLLSQHSVALHPWKSSQLKFSICKTGGSKGQVILFEWENSLLSPKGPGWKQQVEAWHALPRGRERTLCVLGSVCSPWLCCSDFSEESVLVDRLLPFHLWNAWLFQGIRGLQRESGKHNRLQFLMSQEGFQTPSRSWYKNTLLSGSDAVQGMRTLRWSTGVLWTENFRVRQTCHNPGLIQIPCQLDF